MAKIPKQGGGGTEWGHRSNRVNSIRRGGNPHAGGGGTGRKPPKKGCALVALAGLGGVLATLATGSAALYHWFA